MTRAGLWIAGVLATCVGGLVAFTAVYAAWQHNPQEDFHSASHINWADLGVIGASWFMAVAGGVFLAAGVFVLIVQAVRKWFGQREVTE